MWLKRPRRVLGQKLRMIVTIPVQSKIQLRSTLEVPLRNLREAIQLWCLSTIRRMVMRSGAILRNGKLQSPKLRAKEAVLPSSPASATLLGLKKPSQVRSWASSFLESSGRLFKYRKTTVTLCRIAACYLFRATLWRRRTIEATWTSMSGCTLTTPRSWSGWRTVSMSFRRYTRTTSSVVLKSGRIC